MITNNSQFDHNFEILRQTMQDQDDFSNTNSSRCRLTELRPIEEIPHPFQQVFAGYSSFNAIQSKVIDDVLYTDDSIVVSAPTGSGKTAIFELAIIRLLIFLERIQFSIAFKIVYICPMKALCEERLVDWHKKFSPLGINAISVTGDSEDVEFQDLLNHNLIITTPEKWDCLTRKWRENINLVQIIKLFMIDEIHLLNEESRGSTLETIVCRMKTIEETVNTEENDYLNHKIRFIGVSATVPNIEDVAEWIGKTSNAKCYKFTDEYRPVKLNKIVLGYPYSLKTSSFKFDLSLNYKLRNLIMQYSHGKPTLIFCGTRKIAEMTAKHLLQHLTINLKPEQKQRLLEAAGSITDIKVKETLIHGVGYHHAGMLPETRKVIENLFRNSELPILVTTRTLATGVNLPAHLVIIKSTKCYTNGSFKDYTETALLQMIGRAGRPQYDTEATALILTTTKDKEKFEKMIGGLQPIESNLHRHLVEHLNAEVVLQTITDLEVALRWLSSTFLYIRARKNPRFYGLSSSDPSLIDRKLLEMCQIELNKLIKAGMLTMDQDVLLKATPLGAAMARYYLAFETMKLFTQINGEEILQQILMLISKCHEFSEMYLRVNDKKCLNLLNKCRNRETIRFPLNGKIKTIDMKINCIIQAVLGCLDICDHSILTEALKIMRNGERIVKCLIEYLESKDKCYQALLNTIILAKCFHVKLWENSPYVSKQLPGIGSVMSRQLVNAGKTSFEILAECDPRELELLINKKPPAGAKLLDQIARLPKYVLKFEIYSKNKLKLIISLENALDLDRTCTVNRNSLMYLLVGDSLNNILLYEKYSHSFLIENPDVIKFIEFEDSNVEYIEANFISEDWVGIDSVKKFEINQKTDKDQVKVVKKNKKQNQNQNPDLMYMQKFMEMYLKCKKNKDVQMMKPIGKTPVNENTFEENAENQKNVYNESNNSKIIIHGNITIVDKNRSEIESNSTENQSRKIEKKNSLKESSDSPIDLSHSTLSSCLQSTKDNFFSPDSGYSKENIITQSVTKNFGFKSKKLTHKRDVEFDEAQDAELVAVSPYKKINIDNKARNQTKITWRSPLTYSPPVKFSPKINYKNLVESSRETNSVTSRGSYSSILSEVNSKNLNYTLNSPLSRTPLKSNTQSQSKVVFPLSDKAFADSSLEESIEKRDEILEQVGDVASTTFLEDFGLISPSERQKIKSQVKTPNEYYKQLVSRSQNEKNFNVLSEEKKLNTTKALKPRELKLESEITVKHDFGLNCSRKNSYKEDNDTFSNEILKHSFGKTFLQENSNTFSERTLNYARKNLTEKNSNPKSDEIFKRSLRKTPSRESNDTFNSKSVKLSKKCFVKENNDSSSNELVKHSLNTTFPKDNVHSFSNSTFKHSSKENFDSASSEFLKQSLNRSPYFNFSSDGHLSNIANRNEFRSENLRNLHSVKTNRYEQNLRTSPDRGSMISHYRISLDKYKENDFASDKSCIMTDCVSNKSICRQNSNQSYKNNSDKRQNYIHENKIEEVDNDVLNDSFNSLIVDMEIPSEVSPFDYDVNKVSNSWKNDNVESRSLLIKDERDFKRFDKHEDDYKENIPFNESQYQYPIRMRNKDVNVRECFDDIKKDDYQFFQSPYDERLINKYGTNDPQLLSPMNNQKLSFNRQQMSFFPEPLSVVDQNIFVPNLDFHPSSRHFNSQENLMHTRKLSGTFHPESVNFSDNQQSRLQDFKFRNNIFERSSSLRTNSSILDHPDNFRMRFRYNQSFAPHESYQYLRRMMENEEDTSGYNAIPSPDYLNPFEAAQRYASDNMYNSSNFPGLPKYGSLSFGIPFSHNDRLSQESLRFFEGRNDTQDIYFRHSPTDKHYLMQRFFQRESRDRI